MEPTSSLIRLASLRISKADKRTRYQNVCKQRLHSALKYCSMEIIDRKNHSIIILRKKYEVIILLNLFSLLVVESNKTNSKFSDFF